MNIAWTLRRYCARTFHILSTLRRVTVNVISLIGNNRCSCGHISVQQDRNETWIGYFNFSYDFLREEKKEKVGVGGEGSWGLEDGSIFLAAWQLRYRLQLQTKLVYFAEEEFNYHFLLSVLIYYNCSVFLNNIRIRPESVIIILLTFSFGRKKIQKKNRRISYCHSNELSTQYSNSAIRTGAHGQ